MSEVKVNKISPRSGTDVQLGDSGDTITVPSGATFDASNATTTLPATVVTTDGSQTLTNKTIDASQLTGTITPSDNTVTPAKLAYNYNQFRNIIINGDMSIAQRGTSFTSSITSGHYPVDRIEVQSTSTDELAVTTSQDTDVPTGQGFSKSIKIDVTTAETTLDSNELFRIFQKIEAQNLQYLKYGTANAESLTLSFWVKSNKIGTYSCYLYQEDGVRIIGSTYSISASNTWEKKTITFAGDTSGVINNDNGTGLWLVLNLAAGSDWTTTDNTSWGAFSNGKLAYGQSVNFMDTIGNEFYLTGVQLEAGTTASDFEFLPVDVNLERCSRYFYRHLSESTSNAYLVAAMYTTTAAFGAYKFHKPMRAAPTFSTSGTFSSVSNGVVIDLTSITAGSVSTSSTTLTLFLSSTRGATEATLIRTTSDADAYMQFDAEL